MVSSAVEANRSLVLVGVQCGGRAAKWLPIDHHGGGVVAAFRQHRSTHQLVGYQRRGTKALQLDLNLVVRQLTCRR